MGKRYEVVVIGGGIVGNMVAYFLGRHGVNTCLVERQFPAAGTSGATQAWVYSSLKTPAHYALMHQKSVALYEEIMQEHGVDFELERCGCLWVIWDAAEEAEIAAEVAELQGAGIDVELVSAADVHRLEPIVCPDVIRGAAYGKQDGTINPFLVLKQIPMLARAYGVEFLYYTAVTAIEGRRGQFRIWTTRGALDAEVIVIAAGVWSREIAEMIGFALPIIPARGQILVSEHLRRRVLTRTIGNLGMRQLRSNGALLIGALQEPWEQANENTLEGIASIAATAVKLAPSLADIAIIRAFSGVRPIPFDGYPLLGEIPTHPGVYTAVSHSGIGLAPILGLVTSDLIVGRPPSYDIAPYLIKRALNAPKSLPDTIKFR